MSEVVSLVTPRTYPVPSSVGRVVEHALRQARAYHVELTDGDRWVAETLTAGGSLTEEAVGVLDHLMDRGRGQVVSDVHGGDRFTSWAGRVASGVSGSTAARREDSLYRVGYEPSRFSYLGLVAAGRDRLPVTVSSLVRVEPGAVTSEWRPGDDGWRWQRTSPSVLAARQPVLLDRTLVAAVADALESDAVGLVLEGRPRARTLREHDDVLTAAAATAAPAGAHYYAIVAPTDKTAVMNVITISPGPVVKSREGGKWVDDPKVTAQLMGVQPPPLVELDSSALRAVLAQMDGKVNTAASDPDFVESEDSGASGQGTNDTQGADTTAVQAAAVVASIRDERDRLLAGLADSAVRMSELESAALTGDDSAGLVTDFERAAYTAEAARARAARSSRTLAETVRRRTSVTRAELAALRLIGHAVVASCREPTAGDVLTGHRSESQTYWLDGTGPVRVRWGCRLAPPASSRDTIRTEEA